MQRKSSSVVLLKEALATETVSMIVLFRLTISDLFDDLGARSVEVVNRLSLTIRTDPNLVSTSDLKDVTML